MAADRRKRSEQLRREWFSAEQWAHAEGVVFPLLREMARRAHERMGRSGAQ